MVNARGGRQEGERLLEATREAWCREHDLDPATRPWRDEEREALLEHAGGDAVRLQAWARRRLAGEPLAYVVGGFRFGGHWFKSDARGYVTDHEAIWLVRSVVREVDVFRAREGRWPVVAEFGFGGGALGISVLRERPEVDLVGLDIDPAALALGQENADLHGVRPELVVSDGFAAWPRATPPDLIFGDPPWGGEEDLYDEVRDAAHYHAMPAASAYPAEGPAAIHLLILREVARLGWASRLVLNLGVLAEKSVAELRELAAWHYLERPAPGLAVLHAGMLVPSMGSSRPPFMSSTPPTTDLNLRNREAWNTLYGSTHDLVWGRGAVGFLEPFLAQLDAEGLPAPARILDAATGEGRNLPVLLGWGGRVCACDSSEAGLAKIDPQVATQVELTQCELEHMPYAADAFDFILLSDTVETLPEPEPVLRELHRILAPTGRLLCNIPGPEGDVAGPGMAAAENDGYLYREQFFYRFFNDQAAQALLASTGWKVVRDTVMDWTEAAHPGFRDHSHQHRSHVFLLAPVEHEG